jgi:hypothetical protein
MIDRWLRLSCRRHGLVRASHSGLATVITLGVDFCIDALEEALRLHGRPEIFNSDQGSQFTIDPFTDILITRDHDQHGRKGGVARQRVCRAILAHIEVRGGLS